MDHQEHTLIVAGKAVRVIRYNTVIVGAGAAGMGCALRMVELMRQRGVTDAAERVAVVTRGLALGASRMSGSDKQTYYKMGTSPDFPDSAAEFAKTLTAAGCCHEDLALIEGICSLQGFCNLVRVGVPFPHDRMGSFVGYKTDHDPAERATSAGPRTSRFMSECLQREVERHGVAIYDRQEAAAVLARGAGESRRAAGVATVGMDGAVTAFVAENTVLAGGGPGMLYATSVYPPGQVGLHGVALKAGLAAENLTESQFGLASVKFRWNVSGTYMQVIPRIFSTDAEGGDEREFLADYFPSMRSMASNIFLKGYQWPFDPQRIEGHQSSLIDVLVFNETQRGRRVFMDFRRNPVAGGGMAEFDLSDLEKEAAKYLAAAGADQATPILRLAHMNPLAIDIYAEHDIDLAAEPLEIAVCAQHQNGGMAVNKWWESTLPHAFVIGEMAGTHGVKRPGGSALNAGQAGAMRAAEYIVNAYGCELAGETVDAQVAEQLGGLAAKLERFSSGGADALNAGDVIGEIQTRMTRNGGHIRNAAEAKEALAEAVALCRRIEAWGFDVPAGGRLWQAIEAEHMSLTSAAILRAIVELLAAGGGSRGSYLVTSDDGVEIHEDIIDGRTGKPLRMKRENEALRKSILRLRYDAGAEGLFECETVRPRKAPTERKAFEPAWKEFREGGIYGD